MVLKCLKTTCIIIFCSITVFVIGKPSKQERAISGQCPSTFIQCTSTGSCVPIQWQCDGENDCTDGTDEQNCGGSRPTFPTTTTTPFVPVTEPTTITTQRQTVPGQTAGVPGITNAPAVSVPVSVECGADYFYCRTDSACIPLEWLCDGDLDCDDGSDEQVKCSNHQNSVTTPMLKTSSNAVTMVISMKPNSALPTTDGVKATSELPVVSQSQSPYQTQSLVKTTAKLNTVSMATKVQSSRCPQGYYVCDSGSCQPLQWACDGEADCDDASDEKYCNGVSRPGSITQVSSIVPIVPSTNIQIISLPPGTTSKSITFAPVVTSATSKNTGGSSNGASVSGSPECGTDYFYCRLDSLCIPVEWLCDADADCSDGDDENRACPSTQSPPQTTPTIAPLTTLHRSTIRPTTNIKVVSGSTSGVSQTHHSSIPPSGNCPTGFFTCKSTSTCSPSTWLCDGESDCADGSDEQNCSA